MAVTAEFVPVGVLPQLATGLGVSTSVAGLSVSAFAVVVAVLAIPTTALTERIPRKTLLVLALGGYALCNGIAAVAPDFAVLCVGRVVGGLAHAVFYSVVTAYASALVAPERVGRAMSIAFTGASLGTVLGVPVTALIGVQAGWRAAFAVVGIMAALVAVAILVVVPGVPPTHRAPGTIRYRRGTGLPGVVAADVLVFIGHFAAYTYIAPLLGLASIRGGGLSAALLVLGIAGFGGVAMAGAFGDRHLRAAFAGSALAIAVPLALLPLLVASIPGTLVATAVWALGFGGISPLVATAAVRTGAVSTSMAGGVINATGNTGILLGSLLGGGVIAVGALPALPWVAAGVAAAGALGTLLARRGFASRGSAVSRVEA